LTIRPIVTSASAISERRRSLRRSTASATAPAYSGTIRSGTRPAIASRPTMSVEPVRS
jgi:hypothetical protein